LEQLRNCDGAAASMLASPLALPFPPSIGSPPTSGGRGKPHEAIVSKSNAMLAALVVAGRVGDVRVDCFMGSVARVLGTAAAL
jgi:hypothetical protein